jgi:fumarate hydratase subunit alpha
MQVISREEIIEAVSEAVVVASTKLRDDQIRAYEGAIDSETESNSRWILERILENAHVAERERRFPLCNDTGIPHVYIEIGRDAKIPPGLFTALSEGIEKGERELPTRPMAVRGGPLERIAQTRGLYDDPGRLVPAPFLVESIIGKKILITVLMLGGGPELRAKTYRVFHHKNSELILDEAVKWAIEGVSQLGCTPCVPAIGIGRTHYEASALMLRALRFGRFDQQNEWERKIVDILNATEVGPLGFGGNTTALASFVEIGPQRASGARIVCMRLGCCYDPRRATTILG